MIAVSSGEVECFLLQFQSANCAARLNNFRTRQLGCRHRLERHQVRLFRQNMA